MEREQVNILNKINGKLDEIFSPNGKKIFLALFCVAILASAAFAFTFKPAQKAAAPAVQQPKVQQPVQNVVVPEQKKIAQVVEEEVEIEVLDKPEAKMVTLGVINYGRSNPFMPTSETYTNLRRYGLELMAPPETIASDDAEAVKVVATKVSGIMYEPKNPSAILNIEGEDYLVRSGDYINNYKILSIDKDIVTVQLGVNVHKAKVGEIISEETINHNTVYDLENKFGGSKR